MDFSPNTTPEEIIV